VMPSLQSTSSKSCLYSWMGRARLFMRFCTTDSFLGNKYAWQYLRLGSEMLTVLYEDTFITYYYAGTSLNVPLQSPCASQSW
jgi:hypothetical protein